MPARQRAVDRGNAAGRRLVSDLARELEVARLSAALSYAEIGRAIGLSGGQVGRICQGRSPDLSIRRVTQVAAIVGLSVSARTFPDGAPVRDRAHLALLRRFRLRLHPRLRMRMEVPVIDVAAAGFSDARAWDGAIDGLGITTRVEAETHVSDVQALERHVRLKQRDGHVDVVILLLSDARHHRRLLQLDPGGLGELFPVGTRAALASLRDGRTPGGNALVII